MSGGTLSSIRDALLLPIQEAAGILRGDVSDYCQMEGAENDIDFATESAGLVTLMSINGGPQMIRGVRFKEMVLTIGGRVAGLLHKPGLRVDVVFSRDPERARQDVVRALDPSYASADRMGLQMRAILEERADVVGDMTSSESCYMAISTYPESMPPASVKIARARKHEVVRNKLNLRSAIWGRYAQKPDWSLDQLRSDHHATVTRIIDACREYVQIVPHKTDAAVRVLRTMIEPDTPPDWQPSMVGDMAPLRLGQEMPVDGDFSHLFPMSIAHQMFRTAPEAHGRYVEHGGRVYSTLLVELPPNHAQPFDELFAAVPLHVPWRICFHIHTGHDRVLARLGTKLGFATLLGWTNAENRMIATAIQDLQAFAEQENETLVGLSVSACTWGRTRDDVINRQAILARAIESWGNTQVYEDRGDPIESWVATFPAFPRESVAPQCAYQLSEALRMLPLTRPKSPWAQGPTLYSTTDGKLYPILAGSSLQKSSVDLIFAPPGAGKSVKLAADNMAMVLSPGQRILPRIAIIDIGPSANFFVDFLRSVAPPALRSQVVALRLSPDPNESSVNPFDLPLGCTHPFAMTRAFLTNFLWLLLTPSGMREKGIPLMQELSGVIVDAVYDYYSPEEQPMRYDQGRDLDIDTALATHGHHLGETPSWWDVVDTLFDAGLLDLASRAQRFAIPTLNDIPAAIASNRQISDSYGAALVPGTGMKLTVFANTVLQAAIREYPSLAQPSSFDVRHARITSIDLGRVVGGRGDQDVKKTAIFYLLARQLLCSDYYTGSEVLDEIPERYRRYHLERIDADEKIPKKICYDEFHRTSGAEQVRAQVSIDIREGRKYNVRIALLSQLLSDFGTELTSLANNIFLLSRGSGEQDLDVLRRTFSPTVTSMQALQRHVTGPGPLGASMLYLGEIDGEPARTEQVLRLKLGPRELWAYSTTKEDAYLRRSLVQRMGLVRALDTLAERFPSGSAKSSIEALQAAGSSDDTAALDTLVERLAGEGVTAA